MEQNEEMTDSSVEISEHSPTRSVTKTVAEWADVIGVMNDDRSMHNELFFRIDDDMQGKSLAESVTFSLTDAECATLGIDIDSITNADDLAENDIVNGAMETPYLRTISSN